MLALLAVLQALTLVAAGASPAHRVMGAALAVIVCAELWARWLFGRYEAAGAAGASLLMLLNVLSHLGAAAVPFAVPTLQRAVVCALAISCVSAVARASLSRGAGLVEGAGVVAGVVILLMNTLGTPGPLGDVYRVQWRSDDGAMGAVVWNTPGTLVREVRNDARRAISGVDATDESDIVRSSGTDRLPWSLDVHGNESAAALRRSAPAPADLRVRIHRASPTESWRVQLNGGPFHVRANKGYELSFRARSTHAREISVGIAQSVAPWSGLGFGRRVALDARWQRVAERVVLERGDSTARVHFDLATDTGAVELADVTLRRLPEPTNPRAGVAYRFNRRGCRGGDYDSVVSPGVTRVLVLGGAEAVGIGVHERDAFPAQLEMTLTREATRIGVNRRYEVINCGAPSPRLSDVLDFDSRVIRAYAPTIIVVAQAPDRAVERALVDADRSGRWFTLFPTARRVFASTASAERLPAELTHLRAMAETQRTPIHVARWGDAPAAGGAPRDRPAPREAQFADAANRTAAHLMADSAFAANAPPE